MKFYIASFLKIHKISKNIAIGADVITGFPGETEEEFKETIDTIKKIEFTKLHVFPYSRRKGTVADELDNQIDEKIKKERVKILMELSKKLEIKYMENFINKEVIFIPEVSKDDYLIGHTGNYLNVKIKDQENLVGENVKIKLKYVEYPYIIGCKDV